MKTNLYSLAAIICFAILPLFSTAQCKNQSKKSLPMLEPYLHNGQLNSSMLMAGEKAELLMTFYSGHNYRILVTAHPILEKVNFTIFDKNRRELYSSLKHNYAQFYDFNVPSTQQLIVEVDVPESTTKNNIVESGCVSVLVGFKDGK